MEYPNDRALDEAELTTGRYPSDALEIISDFGGHTKTSLRLLLAERGDSMDMMFTYSIISAQGFEHFLPAVSDYARSARSEGDFGLPSPFARAVENQLRINPEAVSGSLGLIVSLTQYLIEHLEKFDLDAAWAQQTEQELSAIVKTIQNNKKQNKSEMATPRKLSD